MSTKIAAKKLNFAWTLLAVVVLWGLIGFMFYTMGSLLRGALL